MRLAELLERLAVAPAAEALRAGWEESMACLPRGPLPFLDPGQLRSQMAYAQVGPAEHDPVLAFAALMRRDRALKRLAWHCRRVLYEAVEDPAAALRAWPDLKPALGARARTFYFILALGAVDYIRARHRRLALPEEVTRTTCTDVNRYRPCCDGVRVKLPGTLLWLRHSVAGALFKVGRHQYMQVPFKGHLLVFRHRRSGDVVALSEAGQRFTAAGWYDGDGGMLDPRAWQTELSMDKAVARGFPVAPTGRVLPHEVRLRREAWDLVLTRGDPVLEMHIPPDEPMPLAATGASMRAAADFFRRYLPERPWGGFSCRSWLFNPQLQEILGRSAHIPAWQREQYLFPVAAEQPAGLSFIFGFRPFDPRTAPRDTRLQRAVAARLERGVPWRNGGMFGLPEDLPYFGQQCYLRRWTRVCRRLGLPAPGPVV